MKTFKYLAAVAGVGIIVLLAYIWIKPNTVSDSYTKTSPSPVTQETKKPTATKPSTSAAVADSESTEITVGYDNDYTEPTPDVTAQFNLGSGSGEQKTVTVQKGQRVRISFTANFRDEVKIDGYNAADNVEPMRDSSISFIVDKTGSFPIRLVKANKIIGTLQVQ